ncbi:MAG: hypothetical protein GX287_03955 [Fusobacteria bacterium]|nr:hypothetical protein [Fusobacteriota bacterium]
MNLRVWNNLQCEIFKDEGVLDILEIYQVGSLIAHLRCLGDKERIIVEAKEIIQQYRNQCKECSNMEEEAF